MSGNSQAIGGKAGHRGPVPHTDGTGAHSRNFDRLYQQKRSTDPESIKRRESLSEQKPKGWFAKAFQR
ncbi:hypothetical protein F4778DRAFT_786789 [Xylariomycetidae sp. FL2044]|nr:hypothetical protein F4778DRAFT_786789 [Xylariomycetidae sp. FL2044]